MKTHILKTEAPYYEHIVSAGKRFEVRKNDRDFHVGDCVVFVKGTDLNECEAVAVGIITYILFDSDLINNQSPIAEEWCVFGFTLFEMRLHKCEV